MQLDSWDLEIINQGEYSFENSIESVNQEQSPAKRLLKETKAFIKLPESAAHNSKDQKIEFLNIMLKFRKKL